MPFLTKRIIAAGLFILLGFALFQLDLVKEAPALVRSAIVVAVVMADRLVSDLL